MADVYSLVNEGGTGAGSYYDGLDAAGKARYGDGSRVYSTLNAWEVDRDGLSSAGNDEVCEIYGDWTANDTTVVDIGGFASGITVKILGLGESKHAGTTSASPSHYRLRCSGGGHCITINHASVEIDGIEIQQAGTGDSDECVRMGLNNGTLTISNCLLWAATTSNDQDLLYIGGSGISCTANVTQCVLWDGPRRGIAVEQFGASGTYTMTVNINSCVIYNCDTSDDQQGSGVGCYQNSPNATFNINVQNTACVGNAGNPGQEDFMEFLADGTINWDIHNTFDSDGSAALRDTGAVNVLEVTPTDNTSPGAGDWIIFTDITSSIPDLSLADDADNDARDQHANASGAGLTIPSTDIIGTNRPQNTNYEIGAFEISTNVLVANPVTYTWSPSSVTLTYAPGSPVMDVGAVAYTWTPSSVTLTPSSGATIVADSVSWSWSATSVSLLQALGKTGEQATLTWTPTGTSLQQGQNIFLAAEGAAFVWTIPAATLQKDSPLSADPVGWTWTVTDVTLNQAVFNLIVLSVAWAWAVGPVTDLPVPEVPAVPHATGKNKGVSRGSPSAAAPAPSPVVRRLNTRGKTADIRQVRRRVERESQDTRRKLR